LFNLAIDSKLRGCDVVAVRVDDVAPSGYAMDRATIRQRKTGRPVRFELTDQTRMAIDEYLRLTGRKSGQFLFAGRGDGTRGLTTRQYARLVQEWVASIGLDPAKFGTIARCRLLRAGISGITYCTRMSSGGGAERDRTADLVNAIHILASLRAAEPLPLPTELPSKDS
jgi:integrase